MNYQHDEVLKHKDEILKRAIIGIKEKWGIYGEQDGISGYMADDTDYQHETDAFILVDDNEKFYRFSDEEGEGVYQKEELNLDDPYVLENLQNFCLQTYKLKLTSKRDVDRIVEIEAANREDAYKIGYGISYGRGFPDDVEIIG